MHFFGVLPTLRSKAWGWGDGDERMQGRGEKKERIQYQENFSRRVMLGGFLVLTQSNFYIC